MVWDTASTILQDSGWKITKADKNTGHILARVKMGPLTLPETFYIDLVRVDDLTTGLRIGGTVPQFLDLGLSSSFIDSFITNLENTLKEQRPRPETSQ